MVEHLTNGREYLSIDTDNKRYTLERICPVEDYELIKDSVFKTKRQALFRNESYRQRWVLPKKLSLTVITDDDSNDGVWIPKRNNRNSKMRYGAHNRTFA